VDGAAVQNARVVAGGADELGVTDATGLLVAEPGRASRLALTISAAGFVDHIRQVDLAEGGEVFLSVQLMPVGTTVRLDPESGVRVEHGGAAADVPASAFQDDAGEPVTGPVDLEFTYVGPGERLDAVGSFGVSGSPDEVLQSLGLVSLKASAGGSRVDLAPGRTVGVSLPAPPQPAGAALPPPPPVWKQNGTTGSWDASGAEWAYSGTAWVAQVDALATWNCDYPTRVSCLRGALVGPNQEPLSGVVVSGAMSGQAASFLSYGTVQRATTGSEGTFCMEVVPNADVALSVACPGGSVVSLGSVVGPDSPGARCSGRNCENLGTLEACCFRDTDCDEAAGETCVKGLCQSNRCDSQQTSGGDAPESRTIELGKASGTFDFTWDMNSIKDHMTVTYEGRVLVDTGCVSGGGSVLLRYTGRATNVVVSVEPNCETGTTGTAWSFSVGCPQ
jgi:hypothetical protein